MNDCNPTAPISTNQVMDVGLLKPRCATFSGNTLNDWIKWLAEEQCKVDWTSFDLTCLRAILQEKTYCEQTQKEVIQTILDAICTLSTRVDALPDEDETVESLVLENDWVAVQTARVVKKGNLVLLRGVIDTGGVSTTITTLPLEFRPSYTLRLPVRTLNTYSSAYEESIQITSGGVVTLAYKGVSPVIASSQSIFLDGICFYV
jgi:hypothetical protein